MPVRQTLPPWHRKAKAPGSWIFRAKSTGATWHGACDGGFGNTASDHHSVSLNGIAASALSALRTNSTALGVVSNNVANLNTDGYARRVKVYLYRDHRYVWVRPSLLRYDASDGVLFTHLDYRDLADMPGYNA